MMENVEKPAFNLIPPSHIKHYQFNILLHNLRVQKINHLLAENGLMRRNATAIGNNCLLDTYFQQIHHYVATNFPIELIKLGSLPEFIQFIRNRIGKVNEEMLSANDELEGLQVPSAVQAYLQNTLNMNVSFNLTVLFADNDGEISLVDTSSLNNHLQQGNICIPIKLICINYNHYEPVFPLGTQFHPQPQILLNNSDDVVIENESIQETVSIKPLVTNIPMKDQPALPRKGLSSKGVLSHQQFIEMLPQDKTWDFGMAVDNGDCFYDAVMQSLHAKGSNSEHTIKSLRKRCSDYIHQLNEIYPQTNWVKVYIEKAKGIDSYEDHLTSVQYTQEEMAKFKQESNVFTGYAIWGKPAIEGKILAEQLGISLHIIEFHEAESTIEIIPPAHILVTGDKASAVEGESINYQDKQMIHLAVYRNHFAPILPCQYSQQQQSNLEEDSKQRMSQFNKHSLENRLSALQIDLPSEKALPAYVVNIPVKVDSDSDNESSSGEEDDQSFSASMFAKPEKYFRLLPPQLPAKDKKGILKKNKNNEQKYKKVYQRGRISDEFLPTANQTTLKSIDEEKDTPSKISKIFQKEAFGKSTTESLAETNKRLAISYGLNKMRSLSKSRNSTLLQVLDKPATNGISVRKVGFFWEGSWQRFKGGQQQWQTADFDTVRKFYRQLKKKSKKKADEFRREAEKRRGHMVPYREIREKLKNHENTKTLVRELRLKSPSGDIYLAFLDSDLISLRNAEHIGTFSIYDENYLAQLYQGNILEIASTGYTIREPGNPLLELGVLCDLWIRHFTAAYIKAGVYYPEPCSIVRVLPTAETVQDSFTIIGESNYESPKEMPILIDNVLVKRKLNPQTTMAFDARGAITTTTPDRMKRNFGATVSQKQGVILWRLADFKTMRDINQSHFNPRDWAINLLHAFKIPKEISYKVGETNYTLKDQKVIKDVLISLLSRLFNAFDPIAIAKNQSQAIGNRPFQKCLINLIDNYESFVFGSVKSTARDYEKKGKSKNKTKADAVTALWKKVDEIGDIASLKQMINAILSLTELSQLNANYIEIAVKAGLKKIVELFKIKLSLNYEEVTLNLLHELFSDNDIQIEKLYDQLPDVYKMIMSNTLLENKSKAIASFKQLKEVPYRILPLHLAAITGNIEAIQWCLEKLDDNKISWVGDITLPASGDILPVHCAIKHCAANGNNLELIKLLCDAKTVTATMDNGLTVVEMIINELDDPLPILDWLFSEYEDDIECIDSDFLTVNYATLLIDAIKGEYGNVAEFLAQFDDYENEITNEILDMAPDIDDKLIEWAREKGYDFEWIIDQLCESEQALFKVNLGFYTDDEESEIDEDNYSLDDAYENENPFIEDKDEFDFDIENDPTEETFLNLLQSELNNYIAYDESDEQKTVGRILKLSYQPDYDHAFSHLDGIERMELIKILYQRFWDGTLRHRPHLTNVNQGVDYPDLKSTYKEKYLKNQKDTIDFQFFDTAKNPIDKFIYKLNNNTLTEIDLSEAKVQPDDFIRLMNALKTNNSVSVLDLSHMELQVIELPDGVLHEIYFQCIYTLSEALVKCESLTTIYLWNNSLTYLHTDSTKMIVSAAKANSHITKIIVNTDHLGGHEVQDDVNDINKRPPSDKRNDRI